MFAPKAILVPTDFSEYSDRAVKEAMDIAAARGQMPRASCSIGLRDAQTARPACSPMGGIPGRSEFQKGDSCGEDSRTREARAAGIPVKHGAASLSPPAVPPWGLVNPGGPSFFSMCPRRGERARQGPAGAGTPDEAVALRRGLFQRIAVQADGQPLPVNVIHHVAAHHIRQVFLLCLEAPHAAAPFRDEEISRLVGAANQVLPVARDPLIDLSLQVSHGSLLFDPCRRRPARAWIGRFEDGESAVSARDNFHQSSAIIQSVNP